MPGRTPTILDDDDRPVGRLLSRREILAIMGAAGTTALVATFAPSVLAQAASPSTAASAGIPACVVSPELTEGPYFVDGQLERSDIRSDPTTGVLREGVPLELRFLISALDGAGCVPLSDAIVDVWHCDAAGAYSAVRDRSFDTTEEHWLRGFQRTDATGAASFLTVYPGWYSGRAVFEQPPYADKGPQDTPNGEDMIFQDVGEVLTLPLVPTTAGFSADMPIGVLVS
jgi:protocatechuate 3,4-dioxygenase beta subunit